MPLITHELTDCRVTAREPATFAALFEFQAYTRPEHRLIPVRESPVAALLAKQEDGLLKCLFRVLKEPAGLGMGPCVQGPQPACSLCLAPCETEVQDFCREVLKV